MNDRKKAAQSAELRAGYEAFLKTKKLERSSRAAHMYALGLAHVAGAAGIPVADIIIELEGELPNYWVSSG